MKKQKINRKKILNFIFKFRERVKEEGWIPSYDPEADSLSYRVRKLPRNTRIKYFGKELALYLTPNSDVKGLFIEYYLSNFLAHQKGLTELKREVEQKTKKDRDVIKLNKVKVNKSLPVLESILQESFAEDAIFISGGN